MEITFFQLPLVHYSLYILGKDKIRTTFKRRKEVVGTLPESIIDDEWSTRCNLPDWDYLFPNGSVGYSCQFCPTNPNVFNVCFAQDGTDQIAVEELVNQPLVKDIGSAFTVIFRYKGEEEYDDEGDNDLNRTDDACYNGDNGESIGANAQNVSEDSASYNGDDYSADTESDKDSLSESEIDELMDSSWRFTYSALPPPTFSKCGKYFTTILNNGFNGVCILEILSDQDISNGDLDDLIAIQCKGSKKMVTGRCKMFAIHDKYAVTVIDIDSSHNYVVTIWRFDYNSKNEPQLKFFWSKKMIELFPSNSEPFDLIIGHEFTDSGKYITFLLADGFYFMLDIEARNCVYSGHLPTLLENPNASQNIMNITHHVLSNQMHFIFGFRNECLSVNPASNNTIECLIKLPTDQLITNVRFSNTKELLSLCTGPEGNVLIYSVTGDRQCNQLYNILDYGSTSTARHCDFSWTSEELLVSYQNGDYRIWQLPRRLKLKEIARIQILKLVRGCDIDQLLLPKSLKEYLFFR